MEIFKGTEVLQGNLLLVELHLFDPFKPELPEPTL